MLSVHVTGRPLDSRIEDRRVGCRVLTVPGTHQKIKSQIARILSAWNS